MSAVAFPNLKPTSRSYSPGEFASIEFKALNGAITKLRYGNRRHNSTLSLTFANISDDNVVLILDHYSLITVTGDWASFTTSNATAGASASLVPWLAESASGLRWRYASSPKVSSVRNGLSTIECEFIANLDGD